MRRLMLALLLITLRLTAMAGDGEYAVSKISPALLVNAHAVVRFYTCAVDMQSLEKVSIKKHFVITILDEKGAKHADIVQWYDKFNQIRSIEGHLYNAAGDKIRSLKSKDIEDRSGFSGNLADDNRYKFHNFYHKGYPYTIEYTIEEINRHTMWLPSWEPVSDEYLSVQNSEYSIKVPADYKLRYKTFNYKPDPVITLVSSDKKIYTWVLKNQAAVVREFASPSWLEITPAVILAPSKFVIGDYEGNMTDWKEFGKFVNALNRGRDILPQATKDKVRSLTRNAGTVPDKVNALYDYLQSTTRYVSIQFGIGGWRPFEAKDVASNSYGDCKALSNYMYALLKEAGIRSHYTLINAGEDKDDLLTDFPSGSFNHAILCVPNGKDTIWLECTSQSRAAGYMGRFTGNRHALLITENGGEVVSTPQYSIKDNLQHRNLVCIVDDEGGLLVKAKTHYTGIQQDDLEMMLGTETKEKIKENLHRRFDFATYDIRNFSYEEKKSSVPEIMENLEIEVRNYATITGKRLFITPNVMTKNYRKLSTDEPRKFDIRLDDAYEDVDTVIITIPEGYSPESVPKDVELKSVFGNYSSQIKLNENRITYYRRLEHFNGRYPSSSYAELASFYEDIYRADRIRIVMVRKGN